MYTLNIYVYYLFYLFFLFYSLVFIGGLVQYVFSQCNKCTSDFNCILNPFGNVPLFVSMSDGMDREVRAKLFKTIALTGFCIMLIFGFVGEFLMKNLYKIEMKELRIAGGFL